VKDIIVKVSKTTILKLTTDEDNMIERTLCKFTEGMDYASAVVHANNKPIGAMKLQKLTYAHLRAEIGLKSQMSCNVARQTAGAYKTLQSQIRKGETYWQLLKFAPTNIKFSYGRDFSINHDELSITTLDGRQKYGIMNYRYAEQFFDGSWKYQASELVKHKDGRYYFHLVCEKEIEEPDITQASNFMGIDVGINHLAVTFTTNGQRKFFTGGEIKNIRNIYSKQRKRLQEKDTRSATRVLKRQSGREKRFMRDVNHVISRQVIESAIADSVSVIGLEDLTGIRKRTKVRKKQRYKHNSWAFRELQTFIEYKAQAAGIIVAYVDPKYTSQTCPTCSHISRNNRNGRSFRCEACGYALNSDLVGAMNIEARTRAFRHDLEVQGLVVDSPDETISSETSLKPLPTGRGN
jgi:IS605 OrfB family transposase